MPLKRCSGEPRLGWDEVYFKMEDIVTGKRVECQVDNYALEDLGLDDPEGRGARPGTDFYERRFPGYLQIFEMFREQIEALASREYDGGERVPWVTRAMVRRHSKSPI